MGRLCVCVCVCVGEAGRVAREKERTERCSDCISFQERLPASDMLGIQDIDEIPSLEQPQAASLVPRGGTVPKEPYRVLWTECSCLHTHKLKPQSLCDDNGRWDLWEVIRVRQVTWMESP